MVSGRSTGLSGWKVTRLLKQGRLGQTVELVAVSWMAKPCGRSSRCMSRRIPPGRGAGVARAAEGRTALTAVTASANARNVDIAEVTLEPPAARNDSGDGRVYATSPLEDNRAHRIKTSVRGEGRRSEVTATNSTARGACDSREPSRVRRCPAGAAP